MTKTIPTRNMDYYFFTKNKYNDSKYTCLSSAERTRSGSGYTKLLDHLKSAHSGYSKTITAVRKDAFEGALLRKATESDKAKNFHGWLELFTRGLEPFFLWKKNTLGSM